MTGSGASVLVKEISMEFAKLPEVTAVVLAGSRGGDSADDGSDIDLYVYAEHEPPKAWRADMARLFGEQASIGNDFWEPGDEWVASRTGKIVDIMYRSPAWIEEQLDRALLRHQASVGYSTCFVYNVQSSKILYDKAKWFASLHAKTLQPYPEPLRRAIIAKNHPILRGTLSSYTHQIATALDRDDGVSVNHRISALLASYFDILFATNRLFHPGEKRLVEYVQAKCSKCPPDFEEQIQDLFSAMAPMNRQNVLARINDLLDGLDELLIKEQLIMPGTGR